MVISSKDFSFDLPGQEEKFLFDLDLKPHKQIDIKQILYTLRDSSLEITGYYGLGHHNSFDVDLSTAGLSIEDLGLRFKKIGSLSKGLLKGRLKIHGSSSNLKDIKVNGLVEGKDLAFDRIGSGSPISDCDFRLDQTVSSEC